LAGGLLAAVLQQDRLADPRLTSDDQHGAVATTNPVGQAIEDGALPSASGEGRRPDSGHSVTIRPPSVPGYTVVSPREPERAQDFCSGRNAARTSAEKSSGSSQAAKWPPLLTSLK
jgi:hypothetical protein